MRRDEDMSMRTRARPSRRAATPAPETVRETASFRAALRRFEHSSEQIARQHGLTPQRYLLLLMIAGAPDGSERSTVGELALALQLAQHTVTELVARAEDAGLLERERSDEDRRVSHLSLTAEGRARLAAAFTDHATERRALLAELGEDQRRSR